MLHVDAPSVVLSLAPPIMRARMLRRSRPQTTVTLHHFDQIINGRPYRIEVSSVGLGKWRAQIAHAPGGSRALMPFYGRTPDEAASHLSHWLSLAHGRPPSQRTPQA